MSIEQLEVAYSNNVIEILQTIGNNAVAYSGFLGDRALEIVISSMDEYLTMLKNIKKDAENVTQSAPNPSLSPQLFNDSMLIHRTRLSRSSRSRLNVMRTSPDMCRQSLQFSPMEVDRATVCDATPISTRRDEESTFIDATREMDETTNERGFLADVSSMNGTVRSRHPSFNFDSISPVKSRVTSTFEYEHETPIFAEMLRETAGKDTNQSIIIIEQTPKTRKHVDTNETPQNLWNVKLRPGSNRKISEEIRKEIQRQLESC